MALLAGRNGVAADQRKAREVVIERGDAAPVVFAVALLALRALLPVMPVVFAMAGDAGRP